jgi:error-prone DNA polymerase
MDGRDGPVPLHVHSHFSLLRGAASVEDLVARAAELGYPALALTDRDALYGAVRFVQACRAAGLAPILGCELTLEGGHHLTLLAESQTGYANLCRLVTLARAGRPKGAAALPPDALAGRTEGLLALSGPRSGEIPRLLRAGRRTEAAQRAAWYRERFADRFYLELQHHLLPDDAWLMAELAALGSALGIPLVATTDVHYARPAQRILQDILTCIRTGTTMDQPSPERLPNGQYALPDPAALRQRFAAYPAALRNAAELAARCAGAAVPDFRAVGFPQPAGLPPGETPDAWLRWLCVRGLRERYRPVRQRMVDQLEHELAVVRQAGLASFFLIAADVAARFRGRCRGSAAGSLIAYCLGMTAVDPLRHDMLFERFVNPERPAPPDIDIDFAEADRVAAIRYLYATYGEAHTAMVCTYVRYRARSAIRDVGPVLGLPAGLCARLAAAVDLDAGGEAVAGAIARLARAPAGAAAAQRLTLLAQLCRQLEDVPRHLGVHVGGMLLAGRPLADLFALEPARAAGIVVVGADKEDVADAGLAKLDLLCLRGLSVVQEAQALERARGVALDLARIDLEDPELYRLLQRADTAGAAQVESRAQMQSLVHTRPRCFRDLINQCALIRPGPIVSGMVHPYYRRRAGREAVRYPHPLLEPILRDTLGVFLFQEQVIRAVMALTGCSAGEADLFRRAMGARRSRAAVERLRPWFLARARANGIPARAAEAVFGQISAFAAFGFCISHAAALARLACEMLYLKRYHPAALYAALLSNQPLGFYPPEVLVWDAHRHGVRILPPDINRSAARCTLEGEPPAVRLGLAQVRGVGPARAAQIVAARAAGGAYRSLADFCQRTGITGRPAEALVLAGAFDGIDGRSRPQQLWTLYGLSGAPAARPLLPEAGEDAAALPVPAGPAQTLLEYQVLGFSLSHHLVAHYRRQLQGLGVLPGRLLARVPAGREVRAGGLVVCRQRPATAGGVVFLTLEDEWGLINVLVPPAVYQRDHAVFRQSPLLAVAGRLERRGGLVTIIAARLYALDLLPPADAPAPAGRAAGPG